MTGLKRRVLPHNTVPEQIQIADGIKNFVGDEFIRIAKTIFVENSIVVEDDGVVHAAAQGQILCTQRFNVAEKAKRSGAADFLQE